MELSTGDAKAVLELKGLIIGYVCKLAETRGGSPLVKAYVRDS